jgi:hypothetical protein
VSTLADQLKAALAFDEHVHADWVDAHRYIATSEDHTIALDAAKAERARTAAIDQALCECVSALERMTKYGANDVTIVTGERALSALRAALEGRGYNKY